MEYIKKRACAILGFAIPAGILIIIAVTLLSIFTSIFLSRKSSSDDVPNFLFLVIGGAICFMFSNAASLFSSVIILSTNWQEEKLEKQKMIWGFLGVFVLGWIAGIIWALIAKNRATNYAGLIGSTEQIIARVPIEPIDQGNHPTAPGRNVYR